MSAPRTLSGRERTFATDEIIVSKTDRRGIITYVNDVFLRVSGYSERELLGSAHNIIRHPAMPRGVFKLLWETIENQREIFAYVLNRAKNGDGYWVFAHVTPSYDLELRHVGYHSNRRCPHSDAIARVKPLYASLLEIERRASSPRAAAEAGYAELQRLLTEQGCDYDEFVFGLSAHTRLETETK